MKVQISNNRYTALQNCWLQVSFNNGANTPMSVGLVCDNGIWVNQSTNVWESVHLYVPLNKGQGVSILQDGDNTAGYEAYIIPISS